jgi:hypothetical protein
MQTIVAVCRNVLRRLMTVPAGRETQRHPADRLHLHQTDVLMGLAGQSRLRLRWEIRHEFDPLRAHRRRVEMGEKLGSFTE